MQDEFQHIEHLAEEFRVRMGIPDDELIDMLDLLVRMRIAGEITEFTVADNAALGGHLAQFDPTANRILIREDVAGHPAATSNRFTIAHEIGHSVGGHRNIRHRKAVGALQFGKSVGADEVFANRFAAALLVPERLARVDQTTTAEDLASRFGVSLTVASRRLLELQRRHRIKNNLIRELPRSAPALSGGPASLPLIDSGEYEDAFPEMLRNAARWNRA